MKRDNLEKYLVKCQSPMVPSLFYFTQKLRNYDNRIPDKTNNLINIYKFYLIENHLQKYLLNVKNSLGYQF